MVSESKSKSLESREYLDFLQQAIAQKGAKWPLPMNTTSLSVHRRVQVQFTESNAIEDHSAAFSR